MHRHYAHHRHHRAHRRRGAALMALGLGMAAGILGCADDHDDHDHRDEPGARADRVLGRLDATEAERAVLRPLMRDLFAEIAALRARGAALRTDVVGGWRGETLDPMRLRERADVEIEALRETAQRVSERLGALHAAMTPAQRQQLVRAMSGGRPRWRD